MKMRPAENRQSNPSSPTVYQREITCKVRRGWLRIFNSGPCRAAGAESVVVSCQQEDPGFEEVGGVVWGGGIAEKKRISLVSGAPGGVLSAPHDTPPHASH